MQEQSTEEHSNTLAHKQEAEDHIREDQESLHSRLQSHRVGDEHSYQHRRDDQKRGSQDEIGQEKTVGAVPAVHVLAVEDISLSGEDGNARQHTDEAEGSQLVQIADPVLDGVLVVSHGSVEAAEDESEEQTLSDASGADQRLAERVEVGSVHQQGQGHMQGLVFEVIIQRGLDSDTLFVGRSRCCIGSQGRVDRGRGNIILNLLESDNETIQTLRRGQLLLCCAKLNKKKQKLV